MAVEIVGKAEKAHWFVFEDGVYSIHKAIKDGRDDVYFRSDLHTWPSITAGKLGVEYDLLVNASLAEAEKFIESENLSLVRIMDA